MKEYAMEHPILTCFILLALIGFANTTARVFSQKNFCVCAPEVGQPR